MVTDAAAFARLIEALRPWLRELVVVGGWAHRLHRAHPLAATPGYLPLMTRDADVAFADRARLDGSIRDALRAVGFDEELSGEHTPPIVHYELQAGGGFYAEFLTPLHGGGSRRDGTPNVTLKKAGVTAQRLRHLDLLLIEPWSVRLSAEAGFPLARVADVPIANPVSFIAQKLLIRSQRPRHKQAQDALYVHDTLDLFGRELNVLRALWRDEVRPSLAERTAREVEKQAATVFASVDSLMVAVARIPQDRKLDPDRIQQLCAYGLERIFGLPSNGGRRDAGELPAG